MGERKEGKSILLVAISTYKAVNLCSQCTYDLHHDDLVDLVDNERHIGLLIVI